MLHDLTTMLHGFAVTLELTFLSFAVAAVLGTVLAVMRVGPVSSLRTVGTLYVEVVRNVPLLVLLVLFIFGLPEVGIRYSLYTSAVICISGYEACYVCEALRSGINTIAVGQAEAARAIGLTFGQSLRYVILPQAIRSVVQPIGNVFIGLALNTSLAAAVGVVEMTGAADRLDLAIVRPIPLFFGAGLGYVIITLSAGSVTGIIERRVAFKR
jgi:glutamate transport system permease protein